MLELDKNRIVPILKNIHNITKLNIAIYDSNMNEIAYYPGNCAFCEAIYQSDAKEICISSNKAAHNQCLKENKTVTYRCTLAMWDTITPLMYNGESIGFIMVGQARTGGNADISQALKPYGIDEKNLVSAYLDVPVCDETFIRSSIAVVETCITYMYANNIIRQKSEMFAYEIKQYIKTRLDKELSVETLCREFHFSKAQLYRVFKKISSVPIHSYIQNERLEYAEELLKTTDLPVSAIAVKAGIPDYNYFSKVFRKRTGISPKAYRDKFGY